MFAVELPPDTHGRHGEPAWSASRYDKISEWIKDTYPDTKHNLGFSMIAFEDEDVAVHCKLVWMNDGKES